MSENIELQQRFLSASMLYHKAHKRPNGDGAIADVMAWMDSNKINEMTDTQFRKFSIELLANVKR